MPHPKGGYRLKDGTKIPGVTTIIGRFKDSSGLLHWACEQGKAIERGEISGLYDKRDEAANIGSISHGLVEQWANGETVSRDGVPDEAWTAFEAFLKWEKMTKLGIISQEESLVSEIHQFGGTLDAIGLIEGELAILDWKTSNGIYPDYLVQLAAYRILWEENYPNKPLTGGFHLCRFSKDSADFSHHYWGNLDEAKEQFLLFRRAYEIDRKLKKRV